MRGAALAVALAACATPAPITSELDLELPMALACRPDALASIEVRALGDFPAAEAREVALDDQSTLHGLPARTRALAIDARGAPSWTGGGVFLTREADTRAPVFLLPYERSCPLPDPDSSLPEGAMAVPLDGSLWIGGGLRDGRPLRRVVELVPGESIARMGAWPDLFQSRAFASATPLSDGSILVTGGLLAEGVVLDIYEAYTRDGVARQGNLRAPRCRHASIALPDGRVLVAGGSDGAGARDDAELVDVERGQTAIVPGDLLGPRVDPSLLALDDGRVLIAGGADDAAQAAQGIVAWSGVGLEPWPVALAARAGAAWVALPGGRLAQVGGPSGEVDLVLEDGSVLSLGAILPALERPTALALPAGEILVIGREGGVRRALLVDPGAGTARELPSTRAPDRLALLSEGTIVELDAAGASLRRMSVRTAWDDPPVLALDGPGRWAREPSLRAEVDGARVELAGSRYASVRVELLVEGDAELLLVRGDARPLAIELGERVRLGECSVARDARVRLERLDGALYLRSASGDAHCAVELPERIGLALRARRGAILRELAVTRL